MEVATLGKFVFFSDSDKLIGLNGFTRTASASYANHDVINGKTKLEFAGLPSDSIVLNAVLRVDLGINPVEQIAILDEMRANGETSRLIVGNVVYGNFQIARTTTTPVEYIENGLLASANVEIELLEYA